MRVVVVLWCKQESTVRGHHDILPPPGTSATGPGRPQHCWTASIRLPWLCARPALVLAAPRRFQGPRVSALALPNFRPHQILLPPRVASASPPPSVHQVRPPHSLLHTPAPLFTMIIFKVRHTPACPALLPRTSYPACSFGLRSAIHNLSISTIRW